MSDVSTAERELSGADLGIKETSSPHEQPQLYEKKGTSPSLSSADRLRHAEQLAEISEAQKGPLSGEKSKSPENNQPVLVEGVTDADLEALDDQTKKTIADARATGKVGEMLFSEETKNGRHVFRLSDPKIPGRTITWAPRPGGSKEGTMMAMFPDINQAQPLALKQSKFNMYMYVAEISVGKGLSDPEVLGELEQVINKATMGDLSERKALIDMLKPRAILDTVYRLRQDANKSEEDKGKYYAARGKLDQKAITELQKAVPGTVQAMALIEQTDRDEGIFFKSGGYFDKPSMDRYEIDTKKNTKPSGLSRKQQILDQLVADGEVANAQDAEIALTIAERILLGTGVAENQGAEPVSGRALTKEQHEARKAVQDSLAGLLNTFIGGGGGKR